MRDKSEINNDLQCFISEILAHLRQLYLLQMYSNKTIKAKEVKKVMINNTSFKKTTCY